MKAKVTWKGEEGTDSKETAMGPHTFKKDEAVELTDENLIKRLQGNQFFDVQVTEETKSAPELQRAPSNTTSPQHPAQKPGEPVPGGTMAPSRK